MANENGKKLDVNQHCFTFLMLDRYPAVLARAKKQKVKTGNINNIKQPQYKYKSIIQINSYNSV